MTDFLELLFGDRDGHVAMAFGSRPYRDESGRYRHLEWRELRHPWPEGRDSLIREVAQEIATGEPVDVYLCPYLRLTDARNGANGPKGSNAAPLTWVAADCDQAPDPERIARLGPMIVHSGTEGHQHVYVQLAEPVDLLTHRMLAEGLRRYLGADAKISDNDVLRLPGTRNWKPTVPLEGVAPGEPVTVRLENPDPKRWKVTDLARLLGVDLDRRTTRKTTSNNQRHNGTAGGVGGPDLDPETPPVPLPRVVTWALNHDDTADRSAAAARVIGACRDSGLTAGQCLSVVLDYPPATGHFGTNGRLSADVLRLYGKPAVGRAAGTGEASAAGPAGFILPAEVWEFSPVMRQVYRAALARQVCPDVVLHAVLAIVASLLNHKSRVATGKGNSVLSYYVIAVGASGAGKTEALSCARELLETWVADRFAITGADGYIDLPLGSGEGMIECFMGRKVVPKLDEHGEKVLDKAGAPVEEEIRAQVRHNALFHTDEGRALLAIDARKGATVMAVLCEMWSGSVAGQTNAEQTRTRKIAAGSYVVGLLLGFQPATIDDLFGDTAGGAPQRFVYADTAHPDITADEVEWPGGLALDVPVTALSLTLPDHLRRQVREHQARRARGESDEAPLDGHRMLLTCRAAVLLTLLHGQQEVTDQYWELAQVLISTSCRLRDHLAGGVERRAAEQARKRREEAVRTQVRAADEMAKAERVRRAADRIVRAVETAGGELSRGRAVHALRADARDVADAAVSLAIADGRLVAEQHPGTGGGGPRQVVTLRLRGGEEAA